MWRALAVRLHADEARLRGAIRTALEAHHADVTREIQATANALYDELRRQPARLVALRTARATIDVGAVVLAIKTGGLSLMDAVWAPATFALSSLLLEGFAGVQMVTTAAGLKKRQYAAVQQTLVERVLAGELRALAGRLEDHGLFAISAARLEAAEQALRAWEEPPHA